MRILGIAGSLRSGSLNAQLLQLAAETLPDGVELAVWEGLRDIPPFDEDTEDDAVASRSRASARPSRAADAVLIATPEYNGSIPGDAQERARLGLAAPARRTCSAESRSP